jgi:hypothetical protein
VLSARRVSPAVHVRTRRFFLTGAPRMSAQKEREQGANAWLGIQQGQAGISALRRLEVPANGSGE